MGRKIINLAYKVGFYLPIPKDNLKQVLNAIFNSYCKVMREDYKYVDFLNCEATTGEEELEIEKEVFQLVEAA
jgi:NAD kinase